MIQTHMRGSKVVVVTRSMEVRSEEATRSEAAIRSCSSKGAAVLEGSSSTLVDDRRRVRFMEQGVAWTELRRRGRFSGCLSFITGVNWSFRGGLLLQVGLLSCT